jgi:hypothetical protein
MMMSKLKILKNTIDIIEECLSSIKYSASFAFVSPEAQVMIDAYKEAESQDIFLFNLGNKGRQDEDDGDDESSELSKNDSSFHLRTLNINELRGG